MGLMNKKEKKRLIRVIISLAVIITALLSDKLNNLGEYKYIIYFLYAAAYITVGYDIIYKAFINLIHLRPFDENFLMTIATFAAFATGEFSEASAVMLFYQIGELFQSIAVGKTRRSISDMMSIVPEFANVERDKMVFEVAPEEVDIGEILLIRPGERIPLDGVVTDGCGYVDTSAITGEAVPIKAECGDNIFSGFISVDSAFRIKVTKKFEDSTVSKILEMVENSSDKKARVENFITRFARVYTPAVTLSALALAVIPPLIAGGDLKEWIMRACVFLIVSCPCALVISVPLGFFGGIGAASSEGILVKGGNFLEAVSETDTVIFDKTGTLTKGKFKVSEIRAQNGVTERDLIFLAKAGEVSSTHPIADSVKEACTDTVDRTRIKNIHEEAGMGVSALFDEKILLVGNAKLLEKNGVAFEKKSSDGLSVYVSYDGRFMGYITVSDSLKDGANEAVSDIKSMGIKKTVMLTGDKYSNAKKVAEALKIDDVYAELFPHDKVNAVEKYLKESNGKVTFVGDGINDAPVLMRSDVGIAMGALGSDAAIEAADIVLIDDDIKKISTVIKIGRRTMKIVKENVAFALSVKFLILILGVFGLANMWLAVFGDVGVTVIAILNSMRTLKTVKNR